MSKWDERADDHAVAHHTYENLPPDVNAKIYMGFVLGARWQREQFREVARNHPDPRCRKHEDDDSGISCGWLRAYEDFLNTLDSPSFPTDSIES